MRWTTLVAFFLALPVAAAPVPKDAGKVEPFWPTAVGTKWVYTQGEHEMVHEITKAEAVKGATRLTTRGWVDRTTDVGPDGVTERTIGKFTLDVLQVRLPLKAGDSWAFSIPIQDGLHCEAGRITVGEEEEVKVPAGTFRATKVVCTLTEVGGKLIEKPYTYTHWYAKGVGEVRMKGDRVERELKSFTPGKK